MTKWPRHGHSKTRLAKDIGKQNALKIQQKMFFHTMSVSKYLSNKEIIDTSIAISGIGHKSSIRLCKEFDIKSFYLQGKGCLGERMRRQLILHQRQQKRHIKKSLIIIGSDLPNLCHLDIVKTISKLKNNDMVFGPSNDGGYWLIAFSKKFNPQNFLPFINIKWSKKNVLKNTIDNLSENIKIDYLETKIDIDNLDDIDQRG